MKTLKTPKGISLQIKDNVEKESKAGVEKEPFWIPSSSSTQEWRPREPPSILWTLSLAIEWNVHEDRRSQLLEYFVIRV